ncbi:hypothetical protein [Methanobrevibacter curvatus]|uniref:Uncharacterized protein n=1 Tax=Methanobrevibacter curvatus TaxID=49547 RepID=A0A165ZHZ8_9EURY|nr:hypothetical protein [Methanobrevibacter curvatus]KZX10759.1 hypothetical protein MBCUR_16740 [Methanobrevibacter curvatus]
MNIIIEEINPNLLKVISEIAKKENKTETKILEDIIEKGIKATKKLTAEDIVSNNPKLNFMEKTNMKSKRTFDDMIGIVKAPKGFNSVEAVREVRRGNYDIP